MERRKLYGGVVALTGVVLAVMQVIHAFQQSREPVFVVVDAVPMVAVALALSFAGSQLAQDDVYAPDLTRVLGWTVGGTVVFVSFAALTLFSQNVAAGEIERAPFVAIDHVTMGATAGMLVGLYDARARQDRRELERERDRVESFGGKAADLNNYGRAIAQSDDVSGVGAFCIEAVSRLFGFGESAVLTVSESDFRVVGNTTVGVDEDSLRALADHARDQEVGDVAVNDGAPVDIDRDVDRSVTVHLAERPDDSVVLVSLSDEEWSLADEDVQLLELLVSHAGMALDRLDAGTTPA